MVGLAASVEGLAGGEGQEGFAEVLVDSRFEPGLPHQDALIGMLDAGTEDFVFCCAEGARLPVGLLAQEAIFEAI